MKKVKITKIKDDAFQGNHPNNINEGYERIGYKINPPALDKRYAIGAEKLDRFPFSTSPVTQLPDENGVFKTLYSTYKLEYLD